MNSSEKFIQIEQAIWQIERKISNKILLGNILQNRGFFNLELYTENDNYDKVLIEDIEKSELYDLIKAEYSVIKFSELKSMSKTHRVNRFNNHGVVGSMNRAQKILSMIPPKQSLPYYWRADDFYKKLGNGKSLGETVVYCVNQITSDKQKELADKKLQSELEKTKASLVEQKHQLQAKSDEINNLKSQLEQANARIAELENKSDNKELPTRTANNASKIILAMAELLQWDLSKPFSDETNGKIREILEKQGNALSKDTVGQWLKQAYDIGK